MEMRLHKGEFQYEECRPILLCVLWANICDERFMYEIFYADHYGHQLANEVMTDVKNNTSTMHGYLVMERLSCVHIFILSPIGQ